MNTELNAATEHEVPVSTAPTTPPNQATVSDTRNDVASILPPIPFASKPMEKMTSLERMEHFKSLADAELRKAKSDLAVDLNNVIGAIKLLNQHGKNGVLSDPLFEEAATFLKLQLNPQPEPAKAKPGESAEQTGSNRVDKTVRQLLLAQGAMSECDIIQALPTFAVERIQRTLKNRSAGTKACFQLVNNKWKAIKK